MRKRITAFLLLCVVLCLCGCKEEKKASAEVKEILMIGDERALYFAEELYNVAKAAGVEMRVCRSSSVWQ